MGIKKTKQLKFTDIPEKNINSAKLDWKKEKLTNTDIMKKYNISHFHFYKLVDIWKSDISGGSSIMTHPQYKELYLGEEFLTVTPENKTDKYKKELNNIIRDIECQKN